MRLFVALWPDAELREVVYDSSRKMMPKKDGWQGRLVDKQNLHVTLAFLGTVSFDRVDCIRAAVENIRWQPFTLQLDQLGYWHRPRVAWFGVTQTPEQLTDMVRQLRQGLLHCDFEPEQRAFHPHLTLARKCRPPRSVDLPVVLAEVLNWDVRNLALVSSVTDPAGVRYEVMDQWGPSDA